MFTWKQAAKTAVTVVRVVVTALDALDLIVACHMQVNSCSCMNFSDLQAQWVNDLLAGCTKAMGHFICR